MNRIAFLPFSLALLWTACGSGTVDLGNGDAAAKTKGIGAAPSGNGDNAEAGATAASNGAGAGAGGSAGSDSAVQEVCLLDRCDDGSQSQVGCTPDAQDAEQCRLGRLLVLGKTSFTDASGDGVLSPGETLHVVTGLINTSTCDNPSAPGIVLTSNYPGIPNGSGFVTFLWNYVMKGGEEQTGTTDIVIPDGVKPGTRIDFELTPTGPAGCEQPLKVSVVVGAGLD